MVRENERKIETEILSMVFILLMFNKRCHVNHFLFFYDQNCISNHKAIYCEKNDLDVFTCQACIVCGRMFDVNAKAKNTCLL